MEDRYFKKAIRPQIYAYTTGQYKNTEWRGEKKGTGLLKVGYTEKDVEARIWEQFPTRTPERQPFEILLKEEAVDTRGNFFNDHLVHKKLEEKGFRRVNGEWFECTVRDAQSAIVAIKKGINISGNRTQDFSLRPEQAEAVRVTAEYFKKYSESKEKRSPHFLWNAKMRFGKTFTSYELARKMGWKKIIVLTYKPAVQSAWKEDLESHINFEGWQFIDREHTFDQIDAKKPFVWFASFQDILGRTKRGKVKDRYKYAKRIEWDCVVV
ncbi:MAG: GIY-YIG nuclease family protein, partial [bacterium]|nr:GIY-YIG nuclease family protein [bacterium]